MDIGHILIVCVGNICRSPMAEALLRQELKGLGIDVESAGLGAMVGEPASEHAIALMAGRGIDISSHRGKQLTPKLVAETDLILVMESRHKRVIDGNEPLSRGKVFRLGEWQNLEIPDPHRQPIEAFEEALELIDKGVTDWVERLKA